MARFTPLNEPIPPIFADALNKAESEPNLFERMLLLHRGYMAQIAAEFKDAPDTSRTHAMVQARTNDFARAIIIRGLLQRHA